MVFVLPSHSLADCAQLRLMACGNRYAKGKQGSPQKGFGHYGLSRLKLHCVGSKTEMHSGVMPGHQEPESAVSTPTWNRLHRLAKFSCSITTASAQAKLDK